MYTREEHANLMREILENASNSERLAELTAQLVEDYNDTLQQLETSTALVETAQAELETAKANAESLRNSNMALLLQIGKKTENVEKPVEKVEKAKSFDDFFDEKGDFKK